MASLAPRVRAHVERAGLFPRPGAAVVAVSGGADSLALLHLLHEMAGDLGLTLIVAHADHGIQTDGRRVAQTVAKIAHTLGLPFELGDLQLGPGATETTARRARYAWLRDVQRRHAATYLVTAHHRDDQIETVLLRVMRGSAPTGLAGISARTRGGLIRPLLPFTHDELAGYVSARGLVAHADPANADPRHVRSWIRTVLLPLVADRLGARVTDDLLRLARHAARDARAWDRVPELLPELAMRVDAAGFSVARDPLVGYDPALAAALLRAAARRTGLVLGPAAARRIAALAARPSGRRLPLADGWSAAVEFDRLVVRREICCALEEIHGVVERGSALFGDFRLSWNPETAPARIERAAWTTWLAEPGWTVRSPKRGDELAPLGGVGHRPVRRLLMEARVPRGARAGYPVLARGETILWVPGICRSADELPEPGTPAVRVDVIGNDAAETNRGA
ncbi:MAG TPA: tRNA lysidine(34) synthetase TilS [Gemmatimonadales bacterium]|nr:tRNA lysidine(34) synthetase TilS [Gemmatimonadales bacterium]